MSRILNSVVDTISAPLAFHAALYWALTLFVVLIGECYFARFGKQPRRFYKRLFDRLHWLVAFGPFALCFAIAADLKGQSGQATAVVFAFLGFFGTVRLLERFHAVAWSWFARPDVQE